MDFTKAISHHPLSFPRLLLPTASPLNFNLLSAREKGCIRILKLSRVKGFRVHLEGLKTFTRPSSPHTLSVGKSLSSRMKWKCVGRGAYELTTHLLFHHATATTTRVSFLCIFFYFFAKSLFYKLLSFYIYICEGILTLLWVKFNDKNTRVKFKMDHSFRFIFLL